MEYDDELERMKARRQQKDQRRPVREHQKPAGKSRRPANAEEMKRYRIQQQKKKKRKRRILTVELIVLAVLLVFTYFFFFKKKDKDGYWTIAVFGVDSRDGNLGKGTLADVQMIANIDRKTGEIKLVSVYRDTYLKINSKGNYHKINEAYFKGGPSQAMDALNENLDLNIDDYATFNWKSVAEAINILGGIDLEITNKEFSMINSFITETVNSTGIPSVHLKKAGMNHLDGVQAVAYSRLRLIDTDFNRTERQRKVVALALEKAKQADFSVLNNILVTVLPQVSTSIGVSDLLPMAKTIKDFHLSESAGFPFARTTTKIGKMDCVIPLTLESNVTQLHQFLFGVESYTSSAAVKKISKKIAEDSGFSEEGKNAETGSSNQGSSKPKPEPTQDQTTAEETTAAETTTEESTEIETETAKEKETTGAEKPTNSDGSLVGPGAQQSKPSENKPTETMPSETKPSENKPSETRPSEAKPSGPSKEPEKESPNETENEVGPGVS